MRTDIVGWFRLQWDRAAAWACVVAGVIMLVIGWAGVSGTAYTAKQLPYIASNGLGGLFLLGAGAMLWLSADLRDEWRKLDRIEQAIREHGTAGLDSAAAQQNGAHQAPWSVDQNAGSNPAPGLSRTVAAGTRS